MPREIRRRITEPEALDALAHPVRLELLSHLIATGAATASECARAIGDTPSNCSYHLRLLAKVGLVAEAQSDDGRERPWQALITGFDTGSADPDAPVSEREAELDALSMQRDHRLQREYLASRHEVPSAWRRADVYSTYALRLTPRELTELGARIDAVIRPYISATREENPPGSAVVHLGLQAFPIGLG